MNKLTLAIATAGLMAGSVAAQSATATLSAATSTVEAGSSVVVTLEVDFTTGAAGPGIFGPAGLFGFGGGLSASGPAAGSATASAVATDPALLLGPVADAVNSGGDLASLAAGRLLASGALVSSPQNVATLSVDIDANASDGDTVTVTFDGAVVLALDDTLATYSTNPGTNQQGLTVVPLTLTVGGGRLCADANGDGLVTPADFTSWILAFNTSNPVADVNQDGLVTPADFTSWILAFNQGANGPTCSP
ncbi:MAG: GC-type dockerin domain-anchored protein [Planctomycetota bacterium]